MHGGSLTCGTALVTRGVWVLHKDLPPHVWVGRNGRVHRHAGCRCVSHFFDGDTRFGVVDVESALVHLHRCDGDEAFFASFESAWRKGLLSSAGRHRIREALPPRTARWLVDLARHDADSGLESLLRLRLHLLGDPLGLPGERPCVGNVDFVAGGWLIIEVDGKENHDGSVQRHKDLRRDAAASARGYETLRFDYAQVVHDWPSVQAAILAALARINA